MIRIVSFVISSPIVLEHTWILSLVFVCLHKKIDLWLISIELLYFIEYLQETKVKLFTMRLENKDLKESPVILVLLDLQDQLGLLVSTVPCSCFMKPSVSRIKMHFTSNPHLSKSESESVSSEWHLGIYQFQAPYEGYKVHWICPSDCWGNAENEFLLNN